MTKLYFHETTSTVGGTLPATTQSGLTITESVEAQSVNRTMDDNRGLGPQTSKAAVINQSTARTTYFTRFCSQPLKAGTISANTWNYSFAAQQSATAMQFPTVTGTTNPIRICAYVWRPSTNAKVGDILNANSNSDFGSTAATTLKCTFGTFAGSAVTAQAGDIICVEVIFIYTPTTGSKTGTYYYDGNTENTGDGVVVSNHATYIETPQTLTFSVVQRSVSETVSITESAAIRVTPGAGNNANILTKKMTLTLDATGTVHDQAFTGVGFQPKAMIVYGVLTTGSAYAEGYSAFYGFSDGASHNACVAVADVDNVSTYDCSNMVRNDACIDLLSTAAGNAELVRGVVKTFDSDGATITWNVKNTTQYIIHVLFIGGTDITNVFVGQTTAGRTSTGAQGYTGVGFKPDVELFAAGSNVTVNTLTAGAAFSIGASVSSAKQFANAIKVMDAITAVSAQNAGVYFAAAQCLAAAKLTASSTWDLRASFTSHDSDGFTLTHNTAPVASTFPFIFMCIKGGFWDAGFLTQKSSSGIQTINPIVYANPEAFLLTICDDIVKDGINITNTASVNVTIGIGACDNTTEGYIAFGDAYQASPCKTVMISSTGKLIRNITPNATATSTTTDSEADISDMATLGDVDINWTTADATARYIGYLILQKGTVSAGTNITRTMATETVSISEAIARQSAKTRSRTETVSISETPTRQTAKKRPLSTETITVGAGTGVRTKGSVRPLGTETVTVAGGTVARVAAKTRTRTETVSISETPTRQVNKFRVLATQTVAISDALSRTSGKIRTLATETVTITGGGLTRLKSAFRTNTETTTISAGTLARQTAKTRTKTETTSITEAAINRTKGANRALTTETTTIGAGTLTRMAAKTRALATQTVTIAETLTRSRGILKTLTESVTVGGETLTRVVGKVRSVIEPTLSITGTPVRSTTKARALAAETISISETVSRQVNAGFQNITKSLSETVIISEILTRVKGVSRSNTESTTIGPGTVTRLAAKIRTLAPETVIIGSGTPTRLTAKVRSLASEIIAVSDNLLRRTSKTRSVTEPTITVSDALSRRTQKVRSLVNNTVSIFEFLTKQIGKSRSLTENVTVGGGTVTRLTRKVRALSETVPISESVTILVNGLVVVGVVTRRSLNRTIMDLKLGVTSISSRSLTNFPFFDPFIIKKRIIRTFKFKRYP